MTLTELYRHPVKSLGEESLDATTLTAGQPVPYDRRWAIAHGKTEWTRENPVWGVPGNFVNQTHVPRLAQIRVAFDDATGTVSLSHPDRPALSVRPEEPADQAALTDWIAPLTEGTTRQGPFGLCAAPGVAFTDFEDTHISIASITSRTALEEMAGQPLEPIRFRMNLWIDGWAPWAEMDLTTGTELTVGGARLRIIDRCERCNATNANPSTGARDTQIPALLHKAFGHRDFGIYAKVVEGGEIRRGDAVTVL